MVQLRNRGPKPKYAEQDEEDRYEAELVCRGEQERENCFARERLRPINNCAC